MTIKQRMQFDRRLAFSSWGQAMRGIKAPAAAIVFVLAFAFGMGNTPARAGLSAAWSFEEKTGAAVLDGSSNYNIGYIRGDIERCDGKAGKAILLKGGSYIEMRDSEDLRLNGPFSIECWWFCATNQNARDAQTLFRKGNRAQYNYEAVIANGKISFSIMDLAGTAHQVSAGIPGEGWHLLDFVHDTKCLRIYIDKDQAGSKEISDVALMTEFDGGFYIGIRKDEGTNERVTCPLEGRLDEFRIYDEALNPAEMGRSPHPAPAGLPGPTGAAPGKELALTKDGRANAAIVIRKGYTELESIPAKELQVYIGKLTGARLPIIEDDAAFEGNMILVGESRYTRELGIDAARMEGDSYLIRSFPGRLALVGHDEQLDVSKPGYYISDAIKWAYPIGIKTVKNGTLNAVYAFLQDYCGIRWLMPGEFGEHVPAKRDLEVAALNITGKPYRLYAFSDRNICESKWADRNFIGRSAGAFVFDPVHTWGYLIPAEKYFEAHPEWFAMNDKGKRVIGKRAPLCTSNREMRAEALKNLRLVYDQGFEMAGLLQSDGYQRCRCPDCEAMDNYRAVGISMPGCPAERIWIFHDYLAREIQKACPGRKVMIYSYGPTEEMSGKIPKLSDNVRINWCNNNTILSRDLIERWRKYHPGPYSMLVYWFFSSEEGDGIPLSYDHIAGELKTLTSCGVNGIFFCGGGKRKKLNEPTFYMIARLLRDPGQDPEAILREFCDGLFEGASGSMHAYFRTLYAGTQRGVDAKHRVQLKAKQLKLDKQSQGEPIFESIPTSELYRLSYPDALLKECAGYLEQARREAAGKPDIKRRVDYFADGFNFIKLTTEGFNLLKACDDADWSKDSIRELIRAVSNRNTVVTDGYSRWSDMLPGRAVSIPLILYGAEYTGEKLATPFKIAQSIMKDKLDISGTNLIPNASFEKLDERGLPAGWVVNGFQTAVAGDDGPKNRKALKLTFDPGQKRAVVRTADFEVTPGAEYYVEFRVKKDAGPRLIPAIVLYSTAGKEKQQGGTSFYGMSENYNRTMENYEVFAGVIKASAENKINRGYMTFELDWFPMNSIKTPKNLYLSGVEAYILTR